MQTEKVIEHIVEWLKAYAESAKVNGFVIGISGGIDSAVASVLCAKTGLTTYCLEMPIHQPLKHVSRGQEHIQFLKHHYPNVKSALSDLTPVFESFKSEVPQVGDTAVRDLALANARARLRMTTLYYYAGMEGLLVTGTGNKVEDFGVGFYTKYGDGGVDLSPLADLMKSEVYQLAKILNVPESILNAAPSDGLFGDERTDEDQIGATYPELEWAMKALENKIPLEEMTSREIEVLHLYKKLHKINQHKMVPIPICNIPIALR